MEHEKPYRYPLTARARQSQFDDSDDLAARVRRAKEAAQRKIDAFGDVSKYEIRKIYGQRTDIDYSRPPEKEEMAVASAAREASTASHKSSRRETQTNHDRQTTIQFGSSGAPEEF